jgi:hypothetical protein
MNIAWKNDRLSLKITLALVLSLVAVFVFCSVKTADAADCEKPDANAGTDQSVKESKRVALDGSAKESGEMVYEWTCNGGTVDNASSAAAEFRAPEVDRDTYYVCTLKAANECGFDYDTVNILVENTSGEVLEKDDENIFSAEPSSGCAPMNKVSLSADIGEQDDANREYAYYFYCSGDVDWSKTIITHETSFTAKNLCDYPEPGTYNAYVRITSNGKPDVKKSIMIAVDDCTSEESSDGGNSGENTDSKNLAVKQLVSNLNDETGYASSIKTHPNKELSFRITLEATGKSLKNVVLTDSLPEGIDNIREVTVDGEPVSGDLQKGLNLGNIDEGTAMTVTFSATVLGSDNFPENETVLTNTAKITCSDNSCSAEDSAEITVSSQIQTDILTANTTGFGDNPLTDSFVIPAGLSLALVWIFRARLIQFEKWIDSRKKNYSIYKSEKTLNLKRARLKVERLADKRH